MLKEEYKKWVCIGEDIPVAATLTEISQAVCVQDQAINFDDSDEEEWVRIPSNQRQNEIGNLPLRRTISAAAGDSQRKCQNGCRAAEGTSLVLRKQINYNS
ncbi:hypothetical protein AVEN_86360-1 [Araneus ventricosus]|uniref:Uncharacterized protein n=1 Tax=Araneus ventricosus TaxID=182803 RepID=A0A4Y2SWA8_ARAVE|nr:hypothetical protein AVEN_86360-1 [Araneus ventricosus]